MGTTMVVIPVEENQSTSFSDGDREYLDGQVLSPDDRPGSKVADDGILRTETPSIELRSPQFSSNPLQRRHSVSYGRECQ
jgi:hypothetical protein